MLNLAVPVHLTIKVREGESIRQWFADNFQETYVRDHNVLTAASWQIKVLNSRYQQDHTLWRVRVKFVNETDLLLFKLRWQ